MREDGKLDYLELPGGDLPASKAFYGAAFGWKFLDYGPEYAAFDEGLDGGFDRRLPRRPALPLPRPGRQRTGGVVGDLTASQRTSTVWAMRSARARSAPSRLMVQTWISRGVEPSAR